MTPLLELLGQFANAATDTAGAVGGGAATYLWRRFRHAESAAKLAKSIAERAWQRTGELNDKLEAFTDGIRIEISMLKDALSRAPTPSRPDFSIDDAQRVRVELLTKIEELRTALAEVRSTQAELRSDILRERGQRHALQSQIVNQAREDSTRWVSMTQAVARIEGGFDLLREQVMTGLRQRM